MKTLVFALIAAMAVMFSGCGKTTEIGENVTREYFIAAEEVDWQYAERGFAPYSSSSATKPPVFQRISSELFPLYTTRVTYNPSDPASDPAAARIGQKYKKYRFVLYTNDTFETKKTYIDPEEELGILGPVIRAQEGDTIKIIFKDKTATEITLDSTALGNWTTETPRTASDGKTIIEYTKFIDTGLVSPALERDTNPAKAYLYQATAKKDREAGLVGPLVIYAKGIYGGGKIVSEVDKEYFTLFKMFNENESALIESNIKKFANVTSAVKVGELKNVGDFRKSNLKFTINGYIYGNFEPVKLSRAQRTRWYVFGDNYAADPSEQNLVNNGWNYGVTWSSGGLFHSLAPGATGWIDIRTTAEIGTHLLYPDTPNNLSFYNRGMFAFYKVTQ